MRKIREVLRLHHLQLSTRQIGESCQISKGAVDNYLRRAKTAGLTWPLPPDLDDATLERRLFTRGVDTYLPSPNRVQPDWQAVQRELNRKGVTLLQLWNEYVAQHPQGYRYSSFGQNFRAWQQRQGLNVTMRQTHKPGERLFVDYAGMTIAITDPTSGAISPAQVFVATLGASNYTYCEVSATQGSADWLASHVRALEFFGGAPQVIVPDNLKAGVKTPGFYEPELNPAYAELAQHYGVAVIPTRVKKPRDKAKVEVGVQIVERHILAPLRDRTFFSVQEANDAVRALLERLNDKPFQKLEGTRRSAFESLEKLALQPLPAERFVIAQWKRVRVNIDYHVELERHYYSVPYQYAREQVELRFTPTTLEVFLHGQRITSHPRPLSTARGRFTTLVEHMPPAHQRQLEWTGERLIAWAQKIGESVAGLVHKILESRPHPEQGFRSCLGLMRLGKVHGEERLEAACKRALALQSYTYASVESILKKRLETEPLPNQAVVAEPVKVSKHRNVRGSSYYATPGDGARGDAVLEQDPALN
jgi:transposase